MKVIIPQHNDQETIFVRTGQSPRFCVYEVDMENRSYHYIKSVDNNHEHHHHKEGEHHHEHDEEHDNEHKKQLLPLADCDYILVLALGPHMKQALQSLHITPIIYKQSEVKLASDALDKFISEYQD